VSFGATLRRLLGLFSVFCWRLAIISLAAQQQREREREQHDTGSRGQLVVVVRLVGRSEQDCGVREDEEARSDWLVGAEDCDGGRSVGGSSSSIISTAHTRRNAPSSALRLRHPNAAAYSPTHTR